MGKVIERIKVTSLFAPERSVEIDAVVDTDETMAALPQEIVDELGLRRIRELKVKYANDRTERKSV